MAAPSSAMERAPKRVRMPATSQTSIVREVGGVEQGEGAFHIKIIIADTAR
jgi:hypothetical protein